MEDCNCDEHFVSVDLDLTKHFVKASKEHRIMTVRGTQRRPDILLETENGDQLWVEFFVTHKTTEEKLNDARISSARVLEIEISGEDCKEMQAIKSHHISVSETVVFHNKDTFGETILPKRTLPCMKYAVYEVTVNGDERFHSMDQPPIEPAIDASYMVVLKLNHFGHWKDTDSGSYIIGNKITTERLEAHCQKRPNKLGGEELDHLVVNEYKSKGYHKKEALTETATAQSQTILRQRPPVLSKSTEKKTQEKDSFRGTFPEKQGWIDLELSSGTLWSSRKGDDLPAPDGYVRSLPTLDDWKEFMKRCKKYIQNDGYFFKTNHDRVLAFHFGTYRLNDEFDRAWYFPEDGGDCCVQLSSNEVAWNRYVAKLLPEQKQTDTNENEQGNALLHNTPSEFQPNHEPPKAEQPPIIRSKNHYFIEDE